MALEIDFKIETTNCCNEVIFTDTTCRYDSSRPAFCCDGYGSDGNIDQTSISYTRFNWALPNNSAYTNIDLGWKPNVGAMTKFTIDSGTNGVIVVCIGGVQIGKEIFVDTIAKLRDALVLAINLNTATTGWYAVATNFLTNEITIYNVSRSTEFNGLGLTLYVNGDLVVTIPVVPTDYNTTSGGDDLSDSLSITMLDLIGPECASDTVAPPFPDGVHRVDYFLYDSVGEEITRKTKYVLLDCNVVSMLKALARLVISNDCKCNVNSLSRKLILFRARYDAALSMFEECDFKCANKEIQQLLEDLKNVCLDCD